MPVPPLGENTVTTWPCRCAASPVRARPGGGLPDGEDDAVGQLRQQHDVGDVGVEGLLEERGRLAGGDRTIGARVCSRIAAISSVGREAPAVRGVQDRRGARP